MESSNFLRTKRYASIARIAIAIELLLLVFGHYEIEATRCLYPPMTAYDPTVPMRWFWCTTPTILIVYVLIPAMLLGTTALLGWFAYRLRGPEC